MVLYSSNQISIYNFPCIYNIVSMLKYLAILSYYMVTKSEQVAKDTLINLGWEPVRIKVNSRFHINVGMPDYQCSNNRYVEIKTNTSKNKTRESAYPDNYDLRASQMVVFGELIRKGYDVYVMVLTTDLRYYSLLKIERLDYKQTLIKRERCPFAVPIISHCNQSL